MMRFYLNCLNIIYFVNCDLILNLSYAKHFIVSDITL